MFSSLSIKNLSGVTILLGLFPFALYSQQCYVEVPASKTEIDFSNDLQDSPAQNILIYSNFYGGSGIGIGDFNRDGKPDIVFGGNLVADQLYLNEGDFKFKRTLPQLLNDDGWTSGVVIADVNGDGWDDIYLCRELYDDDPQRRRNRLLINQGTKDLDFIEAGLIAGVADNRRTRHATFFDYDNDGDLDLYVLNQPPNPGNYSPLLGSNLKLPEYASRLYRNDGNNAAGIPKFTELGPKSGLDVVGFPNSVIAADFDDDGFTDLYITHDYDAPDNYFHNNGNNTFTDLLKTATGHTSFYSMGVDAADINQDGLLDLMTLDMVAEDNFRLKANMSGMNPQAFQDVVAAGGHYQYMFNSLQLNRGNNHFSEISQLAGVSSTDWSWSNLFADLNNDGRQDLYITNGLVRDIRNTDAAKEFATHVSKKINAYIMAHPDDADVTIYDVIDLEEALSIIPSQPLSNYVYENSGDYHFTKRTEEWKLDQPGFSTGSAYADLNGDGLIDLITNNVNAPASIYRNQGDKKNPRNYLRLELKDPSGHTAFGSKVVAYINGQQQYIQTTNVRGMYSTSEQIVHFGLDQAVQVDSIIIRWPDRSQTKLRDVAANQVVTITKAETYTEKTAPINTLYTAFNLNLLNYEHRENVFDDYRFQVLLPHKQSQYGPALAVGDVNNDGLDDLFLGGASGQPSGLHFQNAGGKFSLQQEELWRGASLLEDVTATFFDADGDNDLDLYVGSGGNEFTAGSPFYQDRLYLNEGEGVFALAPSGTLPASSISTGCVVPGDYDNDGDLDLFIGGRLSPRDYPAPVDAKILRNDQGVFTDVTDEIASELNELGMVTSAVWTDLDNDNRPDLLIGGEWMPLTVFYNRTTGFEKATDFTDLPDTRGWWFSITKEDIDNDGDDDFLFGNLGENYKYQASPEEPFEVHYDDFDDDGSKDIVLSYYNNGEQFPLRGRSCSAQQIPLIADKFPSYTEFAGADLEDVFTPGALKQALHLQATTFTSYLGINDGNGKINMQRLPTEAQFGPIMDAVTDDLNKDGYQDLITAGNLYPAEIETARADASLGLVLLGNGKGNFTPLSPQKSGLYLNADVRKLGWMKITAGIKQLVVLPNNERVRFYETGQK